MKLCRNVTTVSRRWLAAAIVQVLAIIFATAVCPRVNADTTIAVTAERRNDAGIVLAVDDLTAALTTAGHKSTVTYRGVSDPLPPGDVILIGAAEGATANVGEKPNGPSPAPAPAGKDQGSEAFRIRPLESAGRQAIVVEGDERGLMYGVFKLAERVRLGDSPWQISLQSAPAFPLRIFSEEGQLLDLPDPAYYSDEPPYANEKRLREEVDQLKRLLRHVAAGGFNTFCFLHLNIEDYIDYRYLDKEIYAKDDRHRLRSPIFCKYLKELCDEAHALHLALYIQVYEFVAPIQMDKVYNVQLDHPDLKTVLDARFKELFERVPLDGMIVTASEQAPRCGYVPKISWPKPDAAGKMAVLFHDACKAAGGKSIFRLWYVGNDVSRAGTIFGMAAPDMTFETKHTGGDFFMFYPLTPIVTTGMPKKQPMVVTFDTFRQYDGWSRLCIYMKQWGDRVRACRDNGVMGINAWGPWSPACNFREVAGMSWVGHWNNFRTFLRGFTLGQANVYLIGRLAWDPDADVSQIARDFCQLHLGAANAEAAAEALMATEEAFVEEYVKKAHPCYFRLAMIYLHNDNYLKVAFEANSLADILASNARALAAVDRMEQAFAKVDPAKAPDADKYARFKESVEKTGLYQRTFYLFREGVWRSNAVKTLKGPEGEANAAALADLKVRLKQFFDQWQRWPEEAGNWRITYRHGKPSEASQRYNEGWGDAKPPATMESDAEQFGNQ